MKKLVYILILNCCMLLSVYGQDFYMYVNGQKQYYEISSTQLLIRTTFTDTMAVKSFVQDKTFGEIRKSEILKEGLVMLELQKEDSKSTLELLRKYNADNTILYTSPVLVDDKGKVIGGITNQVFVRLKDESGYELLLNSARKYGIREVEKCNFDEKTFQLTLSRNTDKTTMEIANELYESRLFESAEPNLIHFVEFSSNDQYYTQQWALKNTGQFGGVPGVDIKINQAWSITTGSPNVRMAILDSGVDLTHPDLQANLLPGFDATGSGGNGGILNNIAHGTACAGIAGAVGNNSIGIAGVAYGCRIIPVSISARETNWSVAESGFIAIAIDSVRRSGASVISMSFGCIRTDILDTEIAQAATVGRNNLGCILVAASGNNNSSVSYPANNENVIAVGAISPCGQRKSPSSCDTETLWGSNFGTQLDIVAPGVLVPTTDIRGNLGYNNNLRIHPINGGNIITNDYSNRDYTVWFNGTSAATPHVAGVAALILSVRPDLTGQQVRNVIEQTAQKVGGYTYATEPGRPNGPWHREVGYGLVNAFEAVYDVAPRIAGHIVVMNEATYNVVNLPAGATVTWSTTNSNLQLVSGQGSGTAKFKSNYYGECTISATVTWGGHSYTARHSVTADFDLYSAFIEDPGFICGNTATFTLRNMPQPALISWNNNPATADSVFSINTSSYTKGIGKVQAHVTYRNKEVSLERHFGYNRPGTHYVESDVIQDNGFYYDSSRGVGGIIVYYLYPLEGIYYNWSSNYGWSLVEGGSDYAVFEGPPVSGYLPISVCFSTPCGSQMCHVREIYVPDGVFGNQGFIAYPNPVIDIVNIELKQPQVVGVNAQDIKKQSGTERYEIQIWNNASMIKRFITDQTVCQIPVNDLPKGIYFVRVIKDGKIYTQKLIKN